MLIHLPDFGCVPVPMHRPSQIDSGPSAENCFAEVSENLEANGWINLMYQKLSHVKFPISDVKYFMLVVKYLKVDIKYWCCL